VAGAQMRRSGAGEKLILDLVCDFIFFADAVCAVPVILFWRKAMPVIIPFIK